MNDKEKLLSPEQVDFLTEMMNIGAGNAATALTQVLQRQVTLVIPRIFVTDEVHQLSILGNPSLPVVCVGMSMVGDASGGLYFIVKLSQIDTLAFEPNNSPPFT